LPELVDQMFNLSDQGDYRATSYLLDRILGKPTQSVEADLTTGGAPFKSYAGIDVDAV
jgi:hypothetical protein